MQSAQRPRSLPVTARSGRASICRSNPWHRGWIFSSRQSCCSRREGEDGNRNETIETVQEAAMAREPVARVLDPCPALHLAFEQVARLRGGRKQGSEQDQ